MNSNDQWKLGRIVLVGVLLGLSRNPLGFIEGLASLVLCALELVVTLAITLAITLAGLALILAGLALVILFLAFPFSYAVHLGRRPKFNPEVVLVAASTLTATILPLFGLAGALTGLGFAVIGIDWDRASATKHIVSVEVHVILFLSMAVGAAIVAQSVRQQFPAFLHVAAFYILHMSGLSVIGAILAFWDPAPQPDPSWMELIGTHVRSAAAIGAGFAARRQARYLALGVFRTKISSQAD